ncbi:multidrug efflux MFS transporter [Vagococcus carniphilus]|uniref:Multidrug efflux MFS transporter n=1 Tax=Vagococcus carniphilus TaxID=218144 RepID=A0AAW8U658_9ENTE|nr:multidrug efflux MFS transporter [Vagococcus carniphilus]MDT2816137.1 multidrug efflux MFS transporter [Vagococcus carniphilus]MDT2829579.1 multidrug efflux MFS transporter [Vagococcus carniphilus]MDT2833719.1 multidrug efflux MFS transporter [Vagococcus carniphilus]MDT2839038.1 multidrug efflux MFS transporter [Vagococcus carniphilus]MDT2847672.1 multidrug efflux MFS transporter [Vagococcus carniphilus]
MEIDWKKNLYIAWVGCFFTGASFSLVMPFIPIYIEQLGAPQNKIEFYSGLSISVTALSGAIFSPIWGNLADRRGRKLMMLRAAAGMTITMGSLAFVPNVFWLLVMRFFNGVLAGYIPNATAMIASQAPREKNGWALGTLATGAVAGNLIGPSMGGFLAETVGIQNVFLVTGAILLANTLMTLFFVKEDFQPIAKKNMVSTKEVFKSVKKPSILIGLFITTLILQIGITSISPILTLYIRDLGGEMDNILFISGLIVSVAGVSTFISSPILGKIGDKVGNQRVLFCGLIFSLICIFPMSMVQTPFQLGLLRFFMGFSTGALMPSINTLISKLTPVEGVSRIFSFNNMFTNLGQVMGPLVGSTVANGYGYRSVFVATSLLITANIVLTFFNFKGELALKNPLK